MGSRTRRSGLAAAAAAGLLALTACGSAEDDAETPEASASAEQSAASGHEGHGDHEASGGQQSASGHESHGMAGHDHPADGGPPPAGIEPAADPTYPVGSTVVLSADHMPGMDGAEATVTGAFDTTAYSVSYTPTDGGEPVEDHRWVVHEELVDPGPAPLPEGTEVVLDAEHMPGMDGAEATIDSATDETVYMVDVDVDGMQMTDHKWVVESEMRPAP